MTHHIDQLHPGMSASIETSIIYETRRRHELPMLGTDPRI